nr:MAG TPA: hypothetical protein [Caudoviricetes sp.]DAW16189.1 MAG TPA: hypothetical protein [Caudoviricetes sp.]
MMIVHSDVADPSRVMSDEGWKPRKVRLLP